jgi:uncharacterized SAM-binding protein YcdF (DUF218 family)
LRQFSRFFMFVFLSKLLPVFIYPLGLTCLFLLLALVQWRRRPMLVKRLVIAALITLILSSNPWISEAFVRSLERQNIPITLPNAEAIVVLGGGIKPATAPRPWLDLNEAGDRIMYGAKLFREGKAPLIILSGGRVAWREGGRPESTDMAEILTLWGVPKAAILEDPTSLNTYENAVNVKRILDRQNIRRVLLVTSALHMPRSMMIFQKQGIQAIPAPTDFLVPDPSPGDWQLEALILKLFPDARALERLTDVLKEYLGLVIYRLQGWL